ncbi:MAG: cytochrome c [Nitrospira sp.]|nr:cytochrome c [Nitrospira sp.]MCP9462909.1 cytochrome c [Nitrospira sp.]
MTLILGRALYEQGRGVGDREIQGKLGNGVELAGSAAACVNCHGRDGRGVSEGGLRAPDIRWSTLTDRFAPARQGVVAVPYDQSSLAQTLATGRRPDGSGLSPAMPRFDLTENEIAALVEQLIALSATASSTPPPGRVLLGLAPQPGLDRTADQLVQIVDQCPETMRPHPTASIQWVRYRNPDDALRQLEGFRSREADLLLVAPYVVGWEDRFAEWTASQPVTVVLPVAFRNPAGSELWLYRLPSVERQVERLIEVAAERHAGGVTLVIDPRDPLSEHLGAVAGRTAETLNLPLERWVAHERTQPSRPEQPLLWLRPMKEMERFIGHTAPRTILIPSLFYQQSRVPKTGRWVKTDWVVAYPYSPRDSSTGRWLAPATVWGRAACTILASLAGDPSGEFSTSLDLAPWPVAIPPRTSDAEARTRVSVMTNPHRPQR